MLTWRLVLASLVTALAVATASSQPARDPTLKTGPFKDYHRWVRMNTMPIFSATHANSFVVTYVKPHRAAGGPRGKVSISGRQRHRQGGIRESGVQPRAAGSRIRDGEARGGIRP